MNREDQSRLDRLLPLYMNGEITPADRRWVDALVASDSEAGRALDWHAGLKRSIEANTEALPADVGLAKLMARVQAEVAPANVRKVHLPPAGVARAKPTLLEWIDGFFARIFSPRVAAFATALLVLQAAIIGGLALRDRPGEELIRSTAPTHVAQRVLQVSFKSSASEREIRMLLTRLNARVADGPSSLGDYIVVVPDTQLESARRELELSGIVENVAAIEWRSDGAKP